jgi:hypothetical protein
LTPVDWLKATFFFLPFSVDGKKREVFSYNKVPRLVLINDKLSSLCKSGCQYGDIKLISEVVDKAKLGMTKKKESVMLRIQRLKPEAEDCEGHFFQEEFWHWLRSSASRSVFIFRFFP